MSTLVVTIFFESGALHMVDSGGQEFVGGDDFILRHLADLIRSSPGHHGHMLINYRHNPGVADECGSSPLEREREYKDKIVLDRLSEITGLNLRHMGVDNALCRVAGLVRTLRVEASTAIQSIENITAASNRYRDDFEREKRTSEELAKKLEFEKILRETAEKTSNNFIHISAARWDEIGKLRIQVDSLRHEFDRVSLARDQADDVLSRIAAMVHPDPHSPDPVDITG